MPCTMPARGPVQPEALVNVDGIYTEEKRRKKRSNNPGERLAGITWCLLYSVTFDPNYSASGKVCRPHHQPIRPIGCCGPPLFETRFPTARCNQPSGPVLSALTGSITEMVVRRFPGRRHGRSFVTYSAPPSSKIGLRVNTLGRANAAKGALSARG